MSTSPLRIAIADDEVDMRDFLLKMLTRLGHDVVVIAADGEELLTECRRTLPDLIITDLKMPHRDGLSAVEELRRERAVPVIFISAYPQELAGNPVVDSAQTTVLVKPVKRVDLDPAIHLVTGPAS